MSIKCSRSFRIGILALISWSSVALADPKEDIAQGQKALEHEDIPEAVKFFRKAAEQNNLQAQFMLGDLQHTQQELEEAFGWFMTAAYQGDAAAAYNMGQMYINGEGVEKNLEKGIYWIKFAAGKNFVTAQEVLVTAYKMGDLGLPVDLEQSKNWDAKATALRAAAKKEFEKDLAASRSEMKALREAEAKDAAERKEAGRKAAGDAAAKRVDDADK